MMMNAKSVNLIKIKEILVLINERINANSLNKGRMASPKRMNFRKSSRGGGVIFNPKNYIADFGPLNRAFSA